MVVHRHLIVSLVCILVSGFATTHVRADSRQPERASEFDSLIERIRAAEASKSWQQPGWKDERLEGGLAKLIDSVKKATGKEFLKLPVELKDASPAAGARQNPRESGSLRVEKENVQVSFANKSIFLIDGSIRISHAADCIVIARGIVDIAHSNRNVILAGHHVNRGFDGSDGARAIRPGGVAGPPQSHGSVVLAGGSINIAHADGSCCSAPKMVEISHASQVAFLASPQLDLSHKQGCTEHKDFVSPIGMLPPATWPTEVFKVRQIVSTDDPERELITVERNGIEYVLRPGNKLVDETGKPIPAWSNWTVGFLAENFVLFTDGVRDVSAHAP